MQWNMAYYDYDVLNITDTEWPAFLCLNSTMCEYRFPFINYENNTVWFQRCMQYANNMYINQNSLY